MGLVSRFADMVREAWERVRLPPELDIAERTRRRPSPERSSGRSYTPRPSWTSSAGEAATTTGRMMAPELTQRFRSWLTDPENEPDTWTNDADGRECLREQIRDKIEVFLAWLAQLEPDQEEHYEVYHEVLAVYCESVDYFEETYTYDEEEDDEDGGPGVGWHRRVG